MEQIFYWKFWAAHQHQNWNLINVGRRVNFLHTDPQDWESIISAYVTLVFMLVARSHRQYPLTS